MSRIKKAKPKPLVGYKIIEHETTPTSRVYLSYSGSSCVPPPRSYLTSSESAPATGRRYSGIKAWRSRCGVLPTIGQLGTTSEAFGSILVGVRSSGHGGKAARGTLGEDDAGGGAIDREDGEARVGASTALGTGWFSYGDGKAGW